MSELCISTIDVKIKIGFFMKIVFSLHSIWILLNVLQIFRLCCEYWGIGIMNNGIEVGRDLQVNGKIKVCTINNNVYLIHVYRKDITVT